MKKIVIHLFHDDSASLGTGSHVAERIRLVHRERGADMEVYVFGPAEQALVGSGDAKFRETMVGLAKNGIPVHVCRNIAEEMGKTEEFTRLGFTLEYARDAFLRYALEGATVVSF